MKIIFRLLVILLGLQFCFSYAASPDPPNFQKLSPADTKKIHEVVKELRKSILSVDTKGLLKQISVTHGLTCTDTDYTYKKINGFLNDKKSHFYISLFDSARFSNSCSSGYPNEHPAISDKEFLLTSKESFKISQIDSDSVEVTIESPIKTHYPRHWYLHKEGKSWKVTGSSFIIGNCTCG